MISHILGTHIENSDVPGKDYVVGTKDQPTEHGLALSVANLHTLDSAMTSLAGSIRALLSHGMSRRSRNSCPTTPTTFIRRRIHTLWGGRQSPQPQIGRAHV